MKILIIYFQLYQGEKSQWNQTDRMIKLLEKDVIHEWDKL